MNKEALIEQIKNMPDGVHFWLDLGWANGWPGEQMLEIVKQCRALGHTPTTTNRDPSMHGLHNEVRCADCGYVYHYDSSG